MWMVCIVINYVIDYKRKKVRESEEFFLCKEVEENIKFFYNIEVLLLMKE